MKDSFLEQKKINTLLYTNKLKKLLIYPNYIDYDKKMYYESVKRLDNLKIMDESVKENIYTLMNYERDNNLFDNNKINEIIRITNCSSSDKTDKFYYNEFKKRIGKLEKIIEINDNFFMDYYMKQLIKLIDDEINYKDEKLYQKYLSVGSDFVKESLCLDFYYLYNLKYFDIDDEVFKKHFVNDKYFINTLYSLIYDNKDYINSDMRDKILYLLKQNKKNILHSLDVNLYKDSKILMKKLK